MISIGEFITGGDRRDEAGDPYPVALALVTRAS